MQVAGRHSIKFFKDIFLIFSTDADTIIFDVDLNTMNVGFQLGAQFLIAKRITLDFYFLGMEVGFLSGDVIAISDQLADANNLKTDIEQKIADLPSFIGDKLTVTQSADKKQINVNADHAPYPWYRGGISIGIAF